MNTVNAMKTRLPMVWLAVLTIYQSYVTTDALSVLKSVEANQAHTLKYMQKSASILKRIRKVADKEHFTVAHDDSPARS